MTDPRPSPRTARSAGLSLLALSRAGWQRVGVVLLLVGAAAATHWHFRQDSAAPAGSARLILVLPDTEAADPAPQAAWQNAADELGLKLEPMSASELVRQRGDGRGDALILPDALHRRMSDALAMTLRERVRAGDRLMLVHDAGLQDIDGRYRAERSRLSDLAGVDYGLYGELGAGMLRETEVQVQPSQIAALGLPPGKLVRGTDDLPYSR